MVAGQQRQSRPRGRASAIQRQFLSELRKRRKNAPTPMKGAVRSSPAARFAAVQVGARRISGPLPPVVWRRLWAQQVAPVSADKIYEIICKGPRGLRPRQGEQAVALCRRAWRVVHRRIRANSIAPCRTLEGASPSRGARKGTKAAADEQVYAFAWGCIERRSLKQERRRSFALSGFSGRKCSGRLFAMDRLPQQGMAKRYQDRTSHTARVWHPLEEQTDGGVVKSHEEAEVILAQLPRRGLPMILREVRGGVTKPFSFSGMQKIVHTTRETIGPAFHLHARRLPARRNDGTGRGRTDDGRVESSGTRERHAHRPANAAGTNIQNELRNEIPNDVTATNTVVAK